MLTPTFEQQQAITMAKTGQSFKMIAFAGAGKTSTLAMIGEVLADKQGIYLAFNKKMADEANKKIPKNVTASTFHAYALKHSSPNIRSKIGKKEPDFYYMCRLFGMPLIKNRTYEFVVPEFIFDKQSQDEEAMAYLDNCFIFGDKKYLFDNQENDWSLLKVSAEERMTYISNRKNNDSVELAQRQYFHIRCLNSFDLFFFTRKIVTTYYDSSDDSLARHHIDEFFEKEFGIIAENSSIYIGILKDLFFGWANQLLTYSSEQIKYDSEEGIYDIHSLYLKLWQLSKPIIHADFILYDEAQDASGVMLDILRNQIHHGVQVIFVGDPHQQIYAWRGAVNAMKQMDIKSSYLTQSFRFGAPIAGVGDIVLKDMLEPNTLTSGRTDLTSTLIKLPPSMYAWKTKEGVVVASQDDVAYQSVIVPLAMDYGANAILTRGNNYAFLSALILNDLGKTFTLNVDKKVLKEIYESFYILQKEEVQTKPLAPLFHLRFLKTWKEVAEHIKDHKDDQELITHYHIYCKFGYERIKEVLSAKDDKCGIYISTIHKAKGLEWDKVFVSNDLAKYLADALWLDKYIRFDEQTPEQSEIKRLFYVAVTRAKDTLIMGSEFYWILDIMRQAQEDNTIDKYNELINRLLTYEKYEDKIRSLGYGYAQNETKLVAFYVLIEKMRHCPPEFRVFYEKELLLLIERYCDKQHSQSFFNELISLINTGANIDAILEFIDKQLKDKAVVNSDIIHQPT